MYINSALPEATESVWTNEHLKHIDLVTEKASDIAVIAVKSEQES